MKALKSRRRLLYYVVACFAMSAPAWAADLTFFRNPGCGCCHAWAEQMKAAGFAVSLLDSNDLAGQMSRLGVPEALQGCHVGKVGEYVISGHVPLEDIKRLLAEKPEGVGLAVPGMPIGSPGMENGDNIEPYEVLLFRTDGTTTVYAKHG